MERRDFPSSVPATFELDARQAAATDFGHLVNRVPEGVLLPESSQDVAATIRWAAQHGRRFAARGRGHSVYGRALVEDGIVVDLSCLDSVEPVLADRVVVGAGATWSQVLAATLRHGLTPPVLTDYLDISVGGTLAVGGVGGTSPTFGLQVDNVLELEAVTGAGAELVCSPDHNRDLFDAIRGGLGQVAVVIRATLALVRANGQWWLPHPWLATFVGDSMAETVVAAELEALDWDHDLGPLGQIVLSPLSAKAIAAPLVRTPPEEHIFALNFIRIPPRADQVVAARLVDANRAAYERIAAAGGTLYPVSAVPLSPTEWRDHYGPAYEPFRAAKELYTHTTCLRLATKCSRLRETSSKAVVEVRAIQSSAARATLK